MNTTTDETNTDNSALDTMELLLKSSHVRTLPKVGDLIEGTVISATKKEVFIDIDGLTTGVVRGPEIIDESGEYQNIQPGDKVIATVIDLENERGEIELSFRSAGHKRAWNAMEELMRAGTVIQVKVLSANKGGIMVSVQRMNGFLPVSQLAPEHYPRVTGGDKNKILEKLQPLIGSMLEVKIIDAIEAEGKLIVSEKKAFEEKQRQTLSSYKVGDVVEGIVSGITSFGAFLRFGEGLEGLIHISELSWQRVDQAQEVVKVGETLKAMIIGLEGSKISLSIKKLQEDPWKQAIERYHVGQRVLGKVTKLNPYGLFVELDPTIQGLAHISELGLGGRNLTTAVKIGDELDFIIVSIDPDHHRLGLSRKLLEKKEDAPAAESSATPAPTASDASAEPTAEAPAPAQETTAQAEETQS